MKKVTYTGGIRHVYCCYERYAISLLIDRILKIEARCAKVHIDDNLIGMLSWHNLPVLLDGYRD